MGDSLFGMHGMALELRAQRLAVLTSNIANAATPGYKARDIDFGSALKAMTQGASAPAAIGAALYDPGRGAVAFTGDGGLLMCLGELATACALGAKVTVVVFNDATLSLIDIKKEQRDMPEGSLGWPMVDFAAVMQGCGGLGLRARDAGEYRAALEQALAHDGPALVDVLVDPGSYPAQIKALRG